MNMAQYKERCARLEREIAELKSMDYRRDASIDFLLQGAETFAGAARMLVEMQSQPLTAAPTAQEPNHE